MINQMSSSMRNFMEAYSAVHNKEAKEEFYSHKDEISEMDFSLINQTELDDIAEEVLEELFEEGYSVEQCEAIFEEVLIEARVTYGSDTESPRAKKMSAVKSSLKGAMGKVKEKAAKGAVKSYGAYRSAKQSATDKANRLKQSAGNASAVTMRKAKDAKAGIKSGIKGMIGNAAKKVGSAANKVASKMSEGIIRKDVGDIYQAIYEKKLDAVGKEDGDIDNDGDEDSSDDYLAKRRKAIGKAMGKKGKGVEEEVEYIDEISQQTKMRAFKDRATREFESDGDNPKDSTKSGKSKADQTKANIVKKHGKKAGEHAERSAHAGIFGRKSFSMPKKPTNEALDPVGKAMGKKGKCEKCGKDPCECDKKEVEEGYKELPKNKMFRKAGNLGREVVSPSTTDEKRQKSYDRSKKIVKTLNKANEEVTFSESELEAIQAKVDAWDVEEGYQRNPEKGEAEARKSETSGQKSERNVRDRLKTMDPKKAEAMKKQMRAVGLNV